MSTRGNGETAEIVRHMGLVHLLLAVGILLACQENGGPPPVGTVSDSAGVAIATIPSSSDTPDWDLSEATTTQIAGDELDPIGAVRGLLWWDSVRIVLADNDMTLRVYDVEGRKLMLLGGRGEGPGEFRDILPISRMASGELAVWDFALNRMTIFGGDGRFARSYNVTKAPDAENPIYLVRDLADGDRLVAKSIPVRSSNPRNPRSDWGISRLLVYSAAAEEWIFTREFVVHPCQDTPPHHCPPEPGRDYGALASSPGGIFLASGDWPEILVLDPDGSLRTIIREGVPGREGFTRMVVAPSGGLWVSRADDTDWLVFDRASLQWRRVRFPEDFRLTDIWGSRALGLRIDTLGVQRAVVLNLPEEIPEK